MRMITMGISADRIIVCYSALIQGAARNAYNVQVTTVIFNDNLLLRTYKKRRSACISWSVNGGLITGVRFRLLPSSD